MTNSPSDGCAVVGIIANPVAGKDIRRLVSAASPVSDMAKIGIVRRAAIGAIEGGADLVVAADDRHALARRALDRQGLPFEILPGAMTSSSLDTRRAAAAMAEREVGAVIVLGGDGTHRDVALGWRNAPMVALSTGTNNVFPSAPEATVAGHAAGLVASGRAPLGQVASAAKAISVGEDLALVDVALTTSSFTGSRAVWDVGSLRELVVAIAEPASVGLSAIAAAVSPLGRCHDGGVHVRFGVEGDAGTTVRVPIAPGLYRDVPVASWRRLAPGEVVDLAGPGTLSFDGERDVVLGAGDRATARIEGDGPMVIDVASAMMVGGS